MKSYLITDFGIAYTRTILLDIVEGQYRFISGALTRTTVAPPEADATTALGRNLEAISERTGRTLIENGSLLMGDSIDGRGFDEFVATASSAGRSLRAVLVGLMDDFSLVSAQQALTGTYIDVLATLSMVDFRSEEERINLILRENPDVVFVVGGTDYGEDDHVRDLLRSVELAVKLLPAEERPIVLYAGNATLRPWVAERLDQAVVLFLAENVRPDLNTESLASAKTKLAQVFDDFLKRQPGGFDDISQVSRKGAGIIPTAQSATYLVRYLDKINGEAGALFVDVGSGTSALISSHDDTYAADIRSNVGLGHSILSTLDLIDWRDIERWLPFTFSLDELEEWVYNKALAPLTIPQTLRDLFIEHAIAREIVRVLVHDFETMPGITLEGVVGYSPIIVGGAVFTRNLPPGLAAMLIMDALQPLGMVDIWLDPYGLAAGLGAVSFEEPTAVVQVVDNGGFTPLGVAFCPEGRRPGAGMKVTITLPDGERIQKQVSSGEIWMPALTPGIEVELDVRLGRGLSIDGKRRIRRKLRAGSAGIIFDMRGRPLRIPAGRRRRQVIADWFTTVTSVEIDPNLLVDETIEAPELEEMVAPVGGNTLDDIRDEEFGYDSLPTTQPDSDFMELFGGETAVTDLREELFG